MQPSLVLDGRREVDEHLDGTVTDVAALGTLVEGGQQHLKPGIEDSDTAGLAVARDVALFTGQPVLAPDLDPGTTFTPVIASHGPAAALPDVTVT